MTFHEDGPAGRGRGGRSDDARRRIRAAAESTRRTAFGKTLTLTGFPDERVKVRPYELVELEDSLVNESGDAFEYVGVLLSIKNVGPRTVREAPTNGARLVTSGGRALSAQIYVDSDDSCDGFGGSVVIPRGQTRRGCVAFRVPTGAQPRYFELTWNSGFADVTGQWSITGTGGGTAPAQRRLADSAARAEASAYRATALNDAPDRPVRATVPVCVRKSRLRVDCKFTVTYGSAERRMSCRHDVVVRLPRTGPAVLRSRRTISCQQG